MPDYAVGASIFLFVVGGVLLYIPTIFEPLSKTATTNALVADQTATYLTNNLLAKGGGSSGIDVVCTAAFFGGNSSLDDTCSFTADDSTRELLGINDDTDVNIVITGAQRIKTDEPISGEVEGVTYQYTRQTGSDQQNTAVATRTVSINGQLYKLIVEVW